MARKHAASALAVMTALTLTACSTGDDGGSGEGGLSGTITVLTNRTDIVETTLRDYVTEFQKTYPDIDVEFEAITDYEGDVSIRLNSQDYGDVLLVPNSVTKDQLPQFFEPLDTVDALSATYRFIDEQAYEGQVYGIATFGTANGYVLNKKVWAEAGITEPPTTPQAFLDALEAVGEKTDATPYYTNYADGWPLSQWQNNQGSFAGAEAVQIRDAQEAPWSDGNEQYALDSLLFDVVAGGLSEADPTTTNWEESKNLLASGDVATMVLGSWAVPQIQAATETVGGAPEDISIWPMPWKTDDAFQSRVGGDYKLGISKHSDNKAAARAWLDWFVTESTFAVDEGGISPVVGAESPDTLKDFDTFGVQQIELTPSPAGQESLDSDIYNEAEIDLFGDQYRRALIDVARGAGSGDRLSFFEDLNSRWDSARIANDG
ncbi:extracellular solute-binding protein [Oerskovia sp. Sa1BUA8]|uniref:Extracellular solute-binding protein n=2 Tax=Oerskovia douganii TaxID=2762210 RepID=A0A9D5YZG0_9CELL|nr:extracellular solute-binding protein [Oerskovia douganii]